jgi:PRTRC genetic system protein C
VEGELPEDGLAAYGDDGDDLMMALARKIVGGEAENEADTVEYTFTQARQAETDAEMLLVDDGWKVVEVGQEVAVINGNGHGADILGQTVEFVLGNDNAANGNGNGHHREAEELRQSLFSWAEFMAEPVKPKRRNGKPQPASMSMSEWAMERERETVGAGRQTAVHGEGTPTTRVSSPRTRQRNRHTDKEGDGPMARVFVYDDREFPDPDPQMTVEQVKGTLADFYGEISNASVKETKRGDDTIYEFQRRVGTKGAFTR